MQKKRKMEGYGKLILTEGNKRNDTIYSECIDMDEWRRRSIKFTNNHHGRSNELDGTALYRVPWEGCGWEGVCAYGPPG